jgi:hypothetical protein
MLHLVRPNRAYDPETVAAMTAAFDRVCQSGSQWINGNDNVKQTLVLIILRHGDRGERDPQRIADVALREWTSADIPQREIAGSYSVPRVSPDDGKDLPGDVTRA